MKGGTRLAQSLRRQDLEKIGFFGVFSRRQNADSTAWQKPDSGNDFQARNFGFSLHGA
jgi:hypothetical protein